MKSLLLVVVASLMLIGCGNRPNTPEARESLEADANAALKGMYARDTGLRDFVERGYGYAIFPSIGKGGAIVGGAYGRGEVYEQGRHIGYAELTQATVGAQLGGQSYRELIVFENNAAFDRFVKGNFEFAANASAVALKSGASAAARYEDGVAVFTMPTGGLMVEAAIGGQRFKFQSDEDMDNRNVRTEVETRTDRDRRTEVEVKETRSTTRP